MSRQSHILTSIRDIFAPIVKIVDYILFEPVRYGIGKHYNAEKYWHDRYAKFGMTLRGSGNRQQTEEENEILYRATTQSFLAVVEHEGISLPDCRVLDIGCGTGYYTRFCYQQGVDSYTGLDITDIFFPQLQKIYPHYRFIKQDLTRQTIPGRYDCIIMFDVIEHITDSKGLTFTIHSILDALSDTGVFILAPLMDKARVKLSYVRYWTQQEVEPLLAGYRVTTSMPFPDGTVVAVRK
jgi:2-polyprenyl-3-methyl-5-hydroxy-6-metoxy-1,4-benzoquinol methylase